MEFVNCLTKMSPFFEWVVSSIRGAKILVWCCVIGFVAAVVDIAHEQHTGVAETSWGQSQATVVRSEDPQAFERIIHFEMVRAAGVLLIAVFTTSMVASVKNYDVFAPGMEFKSLE